MKGLTELSPTHEIVADGGDLAGGPEPSESHTHEVEQKREEVE